MVNSRVDPVYKYIDDLLNKKLKPIKNKLNKLDKDLLRTQRVLAHVEVLSAANDCRRRVRRQKPNTIAAFGEQLTAKLALSLKEVENSANPISVVANFHNWCLEEEKKLGIKFIDVPD